MRNSPFHNFFAEAGFSFQERHGINIARTMGDTALEYKMVRESVALSDASHMQVFRLPEANALDALDPLLAGNPARARFGRILHTFLADESGDVLADCYLANNDDEFLLVVESIREDAEIRDFFLSNARAAGIEDLTESHALISVDGYKAWAVIKDLFGSDTLGLPYLSVENCDFNGEPVRLLRTGKTSEFGYLTLINREKSEGLLKTLLESIKAQGGGLCGSAIHDDLRLEGRFFNIYVEGAVVRDPLQLGLQWMIDFEKPSFCGAAQIRQRREAGLKSKIIGLQALPNQAIPKNASLFDEGMQKGLVVASCFSYELGCKIGLALLQCDVAYAGLTLQLGAPDGPELRTISMPPIMPKSLTVKLDEI